MFFSIYLEKNIFPFPLSPAELIVNVLPNRQCAANLAAPYLFKILTPLFAIADRVLRHQSIRGILPIGPKAKKCENTALISNN
jgi:hypothetical protein